MEYLWIAVGEALAQGSRLPGSGFPCALISLSQETNQPHIVIGSSQRKTRLGLY
jgi:hypothetical protein